MRHRIGPGETVRLARIDPDDSGAFHDKEAGARQLEKDVARLAELQERLYAENSRALLIVLQAMDTGGKDGTIKHVMSAVNPTGCQVKSFKVPSEEERHHDYLWRVHAAVPRLGNIGIFNRSHYEEVLVARVHGLVPKKVWSARYEQINRFEEYLHDNGVTLLKFFLHISKAEQKRRLRARLDDADKLWKFDEGDLAERERWDDYQDAYQDALTRCSTSWAPWFVIPSDKKWYRNLAVARIVVKTLEDMDPRPPRPKFDPSRIAIE